MMTLGGLLGMMIMTAIAGKHLRRSRATAYTVALLFALIQVACVLFDMYTMPLPEGATLLMGH